MIRLKWGWYYRLRHPIRHFRYLRGRRRARRTLAELLDMIDRNIADLKRAADKVTADIEREGK